MSEAGTAKKLLMHLLMHTGKLLQDRVRVELRHTGVHHAQGRVLSILEQQGTLSQADLARRIAITPATMTRMVQGMEQKGWIRRRLDPASGRAMLLSLTPLAKTLAFEVRDAWARTEENIRTSLSEARYADAFPLLEAIRDGLGGSPPRFEPPDKT